MPPRSIYQGARRPLPDAVVISQEINGRIRGMQKMLPEIQGLINALSISEDIGLKLNQRMQQLVKIIGDNKVLTTVIESHQQHDAMHHQSKINDGFEERYEECIALISAISKACFVLKADPTNSIDEYFKDCDFDVAEQDEPQDRDSPELTLEDVIGPDVSRLPSVVWDDWGLRSEGGLVEEDELETVPEQAEPEPEQVEPVPVAPAQVDRILDPVDRIPAPVKIKESSALQITSHSSIEQLNSEIVQLKAQEALLNREYSDIDDILSGIQKKIVDLSASSKSPDKKLGKDLRAKQHELMAKLSEVGDKRDAVSEVREQTEEECQKLFAVAKAAYEKADMIYIQKFSEYEMLHTQVQWKIQQEYDHKNVGVESDVARARAQIELDRYEKQSLYYEEYSKELKTQQEAVLHDSTNKDLILQLNMSCAEHDDLQRAKFDELQQERNVALRALNQEYEAQQAILLLERDWQIARESLEYNEAKTCIVSEMRKAFAVFKQAADDAGEVVPGMREYVGAGATYDTDGMPE